MMELFYKLQKYVQKMGSSRQRKLGFLVCIIGFPVCSFTGIVGYTRYAMWNDEARKKQHQELIQQHWDMQRKAKEKIRQDLED